MVKDGHVNITQNGKWFNTKYDASFERLRFEMDEAEIDKCLLISMPFATTNKFIASVVEKNPNQFRALGHLNFKENIRSQIKELYSMGFSGIKIHPRMQGVNCNNTSMEVFWNTLNNINAVVMIDGYFQISLNSFFLEEIEPFKYDSLVKKYSNITFIFSHLFSHRVFDAYYLVKSNKNVYLDNSHVLCYFKNTSLIQDYIWVMDKIDEKIIYGSDFPEYGLREYFNCFKGLINSNKNIREGIILSNIDKVINFE